MHTQNVIDLGARSDGLALATIFIQKAIDDAGNRGSGVVYFPPGIYLTGTLTMRSRVTLMLDPGATILGSQDPRDYPVVSTRWEGAEQMAHLPLIFADKADDIALEGGGTIDGQGAPWWKMQRARQLPHPRPRMLGLHQCKGVRIDGLRLINSPAWTVHPFCCSNVSVTNTTITSPADSPNTDGIDPESCEDVTIANCHISVGDDCIAIKSGLETNRPLVPCRRISISNCRMESGHGAVVLGSEMSGGVGDVSVTDCVFTGTDRGFRIKTRRGRGGTVEGLRGQNVTMHNVGVPFAVNMFYKYTGAGGTSEEAQDRRHRPVNSGTPTVRNLQFSDVTATDARWAACFLMGLPESPVQTASFRNVSVSMAENADSNEPDMAVGVQHTSRAGFLCTNVTGLSLDRVRVTNQVGSDFVFENVSRA